MQFNNLSMDARVQLLPDTLMSDEFQLLEHNTAWNLTASSAGSTLLWALKAWQLRLHKLTS